MLFSHLGTHIDGYITVSSHSVVVGATGSITGRKADVLRAAWAAAEGALRTITVGAKSTAVVDVMKRCVEPFHCSLVEGVMCHQLKQHVIEGVKGFPIVEPIDEKVVP